MQRRFRFPACLGVCLSVLFASAAAQPLRDPALPLPENQLPALRTLLETAVRQSPRMIARATEETVANAERTIAHAGLLPSMRAWGSYYPWTQEERGDSLGRSNTEKVAYNIYVEQALFHWGALKHTSQIGELRQKISEGQTVEAYRLLVSEIRSQYLQLIMKRLSLERARAGQRLADEGLALAQERFKGNVISEAELFNTRIGSEQARLWTERMQEDYDGARLALGRLCGVPPIADEDLPRSIPEIVTALDKIETAVREFTGDEQPNTFGLQILRRQIEIERLNYRIANTRLRPKVSAVVGITQDEQTYSYSVDRSQKFKYEVQQFYTGITLNWPIFDGFATRATKAASLARRRQLERDYSEQVKNILISVRGRKRQLEFAARGLAMAEEQLSRARQNLRTKEDERERGLVSEADLANTRLQFFDLQMNVFNARNDYMLRAADLLSATMKDPVLASLPHQLR